MRHAIFAPSFDREVENIAIYIDEHFGESARYQFVADLMSVCALLVTVPGIGKMDHEYATNLAGFPFRQNWILFETNGDEVRFLHIVSARRSKNSISF